MSRSDPNASLLLLFCMYHAIFYKEHHTHTSFSIFCHFIISLRSFAYNSNNVIFRRLFPEFCDPTKFVRLNCVSPTLFDHYVGLISLHYQGKDVGSLNFPNSKSAPSTSANTSTESITSEPPTVNQTNSDQASSPQTTTAPQLRRRQLPRLPTPPTGRRLPQTAPSEIEALPKKEEKMEIRPPEIAESKLGAIVISCAIIVVIVMWWYF